MRTQKPQNTELGASVGADRTNGADAALRELNAVAIKFP